MMDERGLAPEQNFLTGDFPCGTENISPYSNASNYSEPSAYYHADYEWQQSQQQQQQQAHAQQIQQEQQMAEPDRHFYSLYPPSSGVSSHPYSYTAHSANTDYYQHTSSDLWTPISTPHAIPANELTGSHRYFSGIDVSQQSRGVSSPPGTGPNGKPKRKRVQSHSQRKAANVRERRRMFHLNEAFDELRKRLPAFNYEKRLSRIETLRLAMTYISFMKEVSVGHDPKSVKLQSHGTDLRSEALLVSAFKCNDSGDNLIVDGDSDCSNDELSNLSG